MSRVPSVLGVLCLLEDGPRSQRLAQVQVECFWQDRLLHQQRAGPTGVSLVGAAFRWLTPCGAQTGGIPVLPFRLHLFVEMCL